METQSITPEAAEREIVLRVRRIEAIRASGGPDGDVQIAVLDAEIAILKKITGPRQLAGVAHIKIPVPGASNSKAHHEDFDEWVKSD